MSYDIMKCVKTVLFLSVSIPLEQGNVLRHMSSSLIILILCLNPFGTGQCLTTTNIEEITMRTNGLNPFGTGQCLTTNCIFCWLKRICCSLNPFGTGQCLTTFFYSVQCVEYWNVSIPLEQGNVLRRKRHHHLLR